MAVEFRLTKHTLRRMGQHEIGREDVAAVLRNPERTDRDQWVERSFARVGGRNVGVVVTRRLAPVRLVVTLLLADED